MFNSNLRLPIKRALISVSDKTGIIELAHALAQAGVEILATGGTFTLLRNANINVVEVSEYTSFPEIMSGRVKTLHPKIHGGLLGRRLEDGEVMVKHNILPIDLLIVNLYPFAQVISKPGCNLEQAIENIDIGGPAMLRSAAKNHHDVAVVVDVNDYQSIIEDIATGGTIYAKRFALATKAFSHTASYDGIIANYLSSLNQDGSHNDFPQNFNCQFNKVQNLRYGENSHQKAACYTSLNVGCSVVGATKLQGKDLSYNNISDADTALECVKTLANPACVIVKHAMPCAVAEDSDICSAYERAFMADSESAFGGVIAFNRELDEECAKSIIDRQFVELIIAPGVTNSALQILSNKPNVRVLDCGLITPTDKHELNFKKVTGGLLIQTLDTATVFFSDLKVVTKRTPTTEEMNNLLFAWKIAKYAKSNAIVYAKDMQTIGIGQGQTSRVNSARIGITKAEQTGFSVQNSVMASDAFFPFRDGIDAAAKALVSAIIQPGGSMRDSEVIDAANEADIAMVFTGMRHFRH